MSLKIIGAGLPRTGTMSLKASLEILGFKPCYHMIEAANNPHHAYEWQKLSQGQNIDWEVIFAGYQAALDLPSQRYYKELMQAYPNAKVLLTIRDPESWYQSINSTFFQMGAERTFLDMVWYRLRCLLSKRKRQLDLLDKLTSKILGQDYFQNRLADRQFILDFFDMHTEAVKLHVPADKLLIYEVKSGWQPLCDFLECPIPEGIQFPHLNDTQSFRQIFADFF